MHETLLNAVLSNTCPLATTRGSEHGEPGKISIHVYDLHCNEIWIVAKLIQCNPEFKYEILDWKFRGSLEKNQMYGWARAFADFSPQI